MRERFVDLLTQVLKKDKEKYEDKSEDSDEEEIKEENEEEIDNDTSIFQWDSPYLWIIISICIIALIIIVMLFMSVFSDNTPQPYYVEETDPVLRENTKYTPSSTEESLVYNTADTTKTSNTANTANMANMANMYTTTEQPKESYRPSEKVSKSKTVVKQDIDENNNMFSLSDKDKKYVGGIKKK